MWSEICQVLELGKIDIGRYRIIKEKKATFTQSLNQQIRRPPQQTDWSNLLLAGDWVDNGLPATIEGSLKSGYTASSYILNA